MIASETMTAQHTLYHWRDLIFTILTDNEGCMSGIYLFIIHNYTEYQSIVKTLAPILPIRRYISQFNQKLLYKNSKTSRDAVLREAWEIISNTKIQATGMFLLE